MEGSNLRSAIVPPAQPFHIAFYRFVHIGDVPLVVQALRELSRGLFGSIRVAPEGINGTVAGTAAQLDGFEQSLSGHTDFAGLFSGMTYRRTGCKTPPFQRMKVHARVEIVSLGIRDLDAVGRPGLQLDPAAWSALLARDDAVVLDNRNRFEYRLGRFRSSIHPASDNFRDLPAFVDRHAAGWRAARRPIGMYCTGGIRCEKTAAWMADAHGLEVHQLAGGILRYLAETPDSSRDWQGDCFVFDNRLALDPGLQQSGARPADVYRNEGDETWRLMRAQRLADGAT